MSVSVRESAGGDVVEIDIKGRFDFALQKEFRDAYRDRDRGTRYRINLAEVEYLDSAALGMLLLLRQHAGDTHDSVTLSSPGDAVEKILRVANFDRLFDID